MRCAEETSEIGHTGHSEEIHSPEECARMVVRRRRPASLSISVDWIVAISCRPRLLRNIQTARQRGIAEGAVGFPGEGGPDDSNERFLWIRRSAWALASAPEMLPIASLERCMGGRLRAQDIKAHRA